MTKLRAPDSIEDAVTQAAALLGPGVIATALSNPLYGSTVSESLVGKWSNPEQPQRIGLHQAIAIETLLIKTGHAPIFKELFDRLLPLPPEGEPESPVAGAMRTTSEAAQLMDRVDQAMADGQLQPHELIGLRAAVERLQKRVARFKRSLFYKPAKKT